MRTSFTFRIDGRRGNDDHAEELKEEDEVETFRRDATFRKEILSLYDQRCAFCRLRVISQDSENIVDGAHILPFSTFRDD